MVLRWVKPKVLQEIVTQTALFKAEFAASPRLCSGVLCPRRLQLFWWVQDGNGHYCSWSSDGLPQQDEGHRSVAKECLLLLTISC